MNTRPFGLGNGCKFFLYNHINISNLSLNLKSSSTPYFDVTFFLGRSMMVSYRFRTLINITVFLWRIAFFSWKRMLRLRKSCIELTAYHLVNFSYQPVVVAVEIVFKLKN